MAAIERRGITKLSTEVAFGSSGTTLFTADDNYLVSVIAANTHSTDAIVHVYVIPSGVTNEDDYGIIAFSLPVSGFNVYETFRFGVNPADVVKVAGSAGVAFYIQGIDQVATV
jgi:hypothetical protein